MKNVIIKPSKISLQNLIRLFLKAFILFGLVITIFWQTIANHLVKLVQLICYSLHNNKVCGKEYMQCIFFVLEINRIPYRKYQ